MKIRRLDLIAFGPFTGARLELSGRPGVVELVYGPNEAGKSTTLRAITGLLFGIPERTEDAHRHAPSELRVGALLETRDGRELEVVRRKGRKSTLRGPDDVPLDDAVLSPLLQGATRELFEALFGLDHERLRESAQQMLAGKGHVGESLFAAGVGGRGIHELSARLSREAEELFLPRARERKVQKAIAEVKDARDAVRNAATSPAKYLEQQRALEDAVRAGSELRARRTELVAEQARLTRIATVLPGLRRRADLVERLAALGDVVDLPRGAAELRARTVHARDDAGRDEARAAEQEARIGARLAELVVPEALLDVDEAVVVAVRSGKERYVAAELDRPKLETQALAIESAVEKSLETTGAATSAATLHLSVAGAARIRSLATRRQLIDDKLESARRLREAARVRRAHLVARLLSRASGPARATGEAALARASELAAPTAETVERFQAERAALDADGTRLRREREHASQKLRDVERRLDVLRRLGDVPTEAELREGRSTRDALWQDLRAPLLEGATVAAGKVESYEFASLAADTVADRLRREADRVAQFSTLEAERASLEAELGAVDGALAALSARDAAYVTSWSAVWTELGVEPATPSEMRAWVRDFEALLSLEPEVATLEGAVERGTAELAEFRARWADAVRGIGLSGEPTEAEAFAVLDALTQLLRQVEKAEGLRKRVEGIERDSSRFAEDVRERCRTHLPAAASLPPAEAAERFVRSVEQARASSAERVRLETELGTARRAMAEHRARREDAEARLSAMLAVARVSTLDALEHAEGRSEAARALREQIAVVEHELVLAGDGVALDVLEAETRGQDLDRARARLRDLDGELEELNEKMGEAGQSIGQRQHGLERMEQTDAAEASALLEDRVACLKRHVHRYVRVRLASVLLDREIERYREANQGPIVARAAELFPRLTVGRYVGLKVGYAGEGEQVLLALRADGSQVGVESLSDGTRDQLYLALRLASLERHARANEPMPLVLDDVLIHFDDDRARATLSVLGDVARTTQVLFFTHHARLVELARSALGEGRLIEHVLPSQA